VVSGEEKMRKPSPEFYQLLLNRYSVDPAKAIFIDDNLRNVEASAREGLIPVHFQSPEQLRNVLRGYSVL
jgi:2-haloacid dehalogenase